MSVIALAILLALLGGTAIQAPAQTALPFAQAMRNAPHSQPLHLQISDSTARPLAMVQGDFDEDGAPDLVIGYSTADGGTLQLLHGNPEATGPRTEAGRLAAAHHETVDAFVQHSGPVAIQTRPELLVAADVNGDGHLDLVYTSRNGDMLYVMPGDGHGGFHSQPLSVTVPGGITALAAWRPGAPVIGEALLVSYTANGAGKLGVLSYSAGQPGLRASYALPAPATSITVANLDADSVPDAAIIADGELLVLHGKDALNGGGRLEVLPVDAAESVTAGEFVFDRHAQMQLAVATTSGDLVILAHQGFDPTPWTPAQIATTRRRGAKNQLSLAQQAGNTGAAPWVEIENHSGALSHPEGTVLVRSRISGSGGDDVIAVSPGTSERTLLRHLESAAPTRSNLSAENSASSVGLGGNRVAMSSFSGVSSSGKVMAAFSMRVNADAQTGLVSLSSNNISLDITLPSAGNTFFVNTTADNTGTTTDPTDGTRCTEGSGESCTLRDAVTFANNDASDNISAGKSDTIMVPAGTYNLTWQAGTTDANTNALTHLEIFGPVTIIGSTSGGGTIINGDNNDTVFTINPGPFGSFTDTSVVFDAALENLVIENGKNTNNINNSGNANFVGGGLNWDAFGTGNLTLTNTTVENCTVLWGPGGGIWAQNSQGGGTGTLTISGGSISNNSTPELGGGIQTAFPPAAVSITNTTISGNKAQISVNPGDGDADGGGGGLYLEGRQPPPATPQSTLTGVTISSNVAANDNGGGIQTFTGILLSGSLISHNSTGGSGGGVWSNPAGDGSQTTITSSNFLSNSASGTGGAIAMGIESQAAGNILQVSLSRIVGNTATGGASGLANGVSGEGAGEAIATENWWGCNTGPTTSADGCDQAALLNGAGSLSTAPYAKLGFTSDVTTIPPGGSMNLTVSLNTDSNNNAISGAFPAVATNYPYTFGVSGVTVSPALTTGTFNTSGVGTATLTPSSTGPGTVNVTFDNQTDSINFTAQGTTATSLSISAIPSTTFLYGQPSGFTVQLTPSNATGITAANFQVTVDGASNIGGNPFGLILVGSNNYQIFGPFNLLSPGGHTLLVNFLGTTDFAASMQSASLNVLAGTVSIGSTVTPPNPIQGQGGTINVTVSGVGSGAQPTGSITYAFDGGTTNTAALSAGAAVISIPTTLSAGSHSVSIFYNGDINYAAATTSASFTLSPPPNYVVTTAADDESTAADCTAQSSTTTGTDSHCTLRDALLAAANASGSGIFFDSTAFASPKIITLTSGTLNIPSSTTITGATTGGGATLQNLVTVSGGGSSGGFSVFSVNSGVTGAAIRNLIIADGYSNSPGGGINTAGSLTVANSSFNDNSSPGDEGGAINNSGTLVVSASSFIGNSASSGDAGVGGAINNSGTLTVGDSTFSANFSNNGGAICNSDGTATISNSTFSANSSGSAGGGAIFGFDGAVTATNNVFVGNSARVGAGVASIGESSVNLSDNVFFNNFDTGGAEDDCASCTSNTQAVDANPMLAPLGNYGGPVQTMLPQPGSAAICAGSAALLPMGLTTDQRGFPRTTSYSLNGTPTVCVDAGAVQTNYQSVQFTNTSFSGTADTPVSPSPVVSVTENGQNIAGVPVTLTFTGTGTATGLGPVTTVANLGASFSSLSVSAAGTDDMLSATLQVTPTYSISTPAPATLDIAQLPQTITFAQPSPVTYGTAPIALSASATSGLPVAFSVLSGPATLSGSMLTVTGAGPVLVEASQPGSTTYAAATPVERTLTVNPASLTVTVNSFTRAFGTANPTLTGTAATFVDGDTAPSTGLVYSSTATSTSAPGTYPITASLTNPAASANYTLNVTPGTLTVTAASSLITWSAPAAIPYGTPLSAVQLDATASVAGSFVYSPTAGTILNAGTQTLSVTFTPSSAPDYATASATTTITVTPAIPSLSFAAIPPQSFGSAPFAVSATSTSPAPITYSVVSGPATVTGNLVTLTGAGAVVLSASQAAYGNYTAATATTSFTVAAPSFTITSSSGSSSNSTPVAVQPGGEAVFQLTLTPVGSTYPDALTLSVTGLPPGATAAFLPATIAAGSPATSITLFIQTSGAQTARNESPISSVALGFGLLPFLVPFAGLKRVRRRLGQMPRLYLALSAVILSLGVILGMSGCGGNYYHAPQNYNVVITATDLTTRAQVSTTLTLTLQ